jgi:hypothetical protein
MRLPTVLRSNCMCVTTCRPRARVVRTYIVRACRRMCGLRVCVVRAPLVHDGFAVDRIDADLPEAHAPQDAVVLADVPRACIALLPQPAHPHACLAIASPAAARRPAPIADERARARAALSSLAPQDGCARVRCRVCASDSVWVAVCVRVCLTLCVWAPESV